MSCHSHAVHIKTELHRLREEAPTKLSAPRRAELGLDTWPTAIKKAGQLQAEDSRMSEVLQGTLRDQREAGMPLIFRCSAKLTLLSQNAVIRLQSMSS